MRKAYVWLSKDQLVAMNDRGDAYGTSELGDAQLFATKAGAELWRAGAGRSGLLTESVGNSIDYCDTWELAIVILRDEEVADWTVDPITGRSNSSERYLSLVEVVERLIRSDAHQLIAGNARSTAGLIVAQLAHKHCLAPRLVTIDH